MSTRNPTQSQQRLMERAASQPRVYLAGFDVFRIDAKAHGEHLKQLCRARGFIGLYPLDGDVPSFLHPLEAARVIYMANIEAIRAADFVMANLNDFRGPGEPDSGTAFEVGFAAALGKPVTEGETPIIIQRKKALLEGIF